MMTISKIGRVNTGFTLIELLIVIAIVAILAAILFPVFATAREKARQSACMSNMKQIGISLMQYTQDYDESFPVGANNCGFMWCSEILPYVKSYSVFLCPDDPLKLSTNSWGGVVVSYVSNGTYAWSGQNYFTGVMGVVSDLGSSTAPWNVRISEIQRPAESVAIAEQEQVMPASAGQVADQICSYSAWPVIRGGGGQTATPDASRAWTSLGIFDPAGPNGGVTAMHTGLANFVFCDGHAKSIAPYLTNVTGNNMWNVKRS